MAHATKIPENPQYTFGINQAFDAFDSGWRTFPGHYLLYAATGVFHLEVEQAHWLLPPQRAAWIRAHVPIRIRVDQPVTCSSVLFTEDSIAKPHLACQVFTISTLAREMLIYATQWGLDRDANDATANRFFLSLATVCGELAVDPDEFWLPRAQSTELENALTYTLAHLDGNPAFADVANAANVSERTLARRFAEETTMTWSQYIRQARMIRAMELLTNLETKVIEVAYSVGFSSVSAFNHAFREFTGETPSAYRKRFEPA